MNRRTWILAAVLFSFMAVPSSQAAQLRIERLTGVYPSTPIEVPVFADSVTSPLSGFTLTIALNEANYSVLTVNPGAFPTNCGWEYFSWQTIDTTVPDHPISHDRPTSLLHITALASATAGYVPACFTDTSPLELARITLLTGSWKMWNPLDCATEPLAFFWRSCGDNILLSADGDTAFCAAFLKTDATADTSDWPFPGYGVPGSACLTDSVPVYLPAFTAVDGALEYACDVYGMRGDVNLNGFPYEAADAVVFTNYFIHGLAVFTINVNGQIAATDVNCDGAILTLPDLIHLLRVMIGDIPPCLGSQFKPAPQQQHTVRLTIADNGTLVLTSDAPVRALAVTLLGSDHPTSPLTTTTFGRIGDTTTCLLVNPDASVVLAAGSHTIAHLAANSATILSAEAVDESGAAMAVVTALVGLPSQFTLSQNYPNPFNPTTSIGFSLPVASNWTLKITNIAGQEIAVRTGFSQAGETNITLDASAWASGVYLYTLTTGGFTTTRKMTLLK